MRTEQWGETCEGGSDAQGHVAEQPLLSAAAVAVSQGGDHLVLLRRHVQTLVAVHVQQGKALQRGGPRGMQLGANTAHVAVCF